MVQFGLAGQRLAPGAGGPALPPTAACGDSARCPPSSSPACGVAGSLRIPPAPPAPRHPTQRGLYGASHPLQPGIPCSIRCGASHPLQHVLHGMSCPTAAWCPKPCAPCHAPRAVRCLLPRAELGLQHTRTPETEFCLPAPGRVAATGLLYIGQPCPGEALNGAGSVLSTRRVIRGYFWGQQLQAFVTFGPCALTPRGAELGEVAGAGGGTGRHGGEAAERGACVGQGTGLWGGVGQGDWGRGWLKGAAGRPSHRGCVGLWALPWGGPCVWKGWPGRWL